MAVKHRQKKYRKAKLVVIKIKGIYGKRKLSPRKFEFLRNLQGGAGHSRKWSKIWKGNALEVPLITRRITTQYLVLGLESY